MRIAGEKPPAAQALAEPLAEMKFLRSGQVRMVEIIVAIGVEEAVGQDRWSEFHWLAEQRLQAARGPRIAAGLESVGHAEGRVETARPPRKLRAHRQEAPGEELHSFVIEAERGG